MEPPIGWGWPAQLLRGGPLTTGLRHVGSGVSWARPNADVTGGHRHFPQAGPAAWRKFLDGNRESTGQWRTNLPRPEGCA
jgi:hypothetical protein